MENIEKEKNQTNNDENKNETLLNNEETNVSKEESSEQIINENTDTLNNEEKREDEKDKEIEKLKAEIATLKEQYIRKAADFENAKKRLEKEKEEFLKYANEKIILKVLEFADNLERAIHSSTTTKDFDAMLKGVEMTLEHLRHLLEVEGVKPLDAVGKEFNPYEHHAVMTEETDEHQENTVMIELQKGYKMKDKVIRPSLVKVAKKKTK